MFQRREPRTILQNIREVFWPSMGWVRAFQYVKHRIIRLSDSSHRIAVGLACGAIISYTPLVGTHFIQAGILAYIFKGNLLASLIGTFVGNPWTFPFLWWAAIEFGSLMFSIVGLPASTALPEVVNFEVMWTLITTDPLRIFLPWLVGGYLMAIISFPVFYFIFFHLVRTAKIARIKARKRHIHKAAQDMTGQKE